MQKARYLVALSCACASAACSTEIATAVYPRRMDAGTPGLPDKPPQCNSSRIIDRLSQASIPLPEGVRYKRGLSYFGLPQDERIAFSSSINNVSFVAWLNNSGTHVHVTPLALTATEMTRFGTDYIVQGTELSGLVALDDGFAILTRRTDIGEALGEGGMPVQATHLVRWQNGRELFAVPLTGTRSITNADLSEKRDYPISQSARLVFNGTHYGAYFSVRGFDAPAGGPPEDRWPGQLGDKFVQVDDGGRLVSAWRMGCRQHLQGRIVVDGSAFVPFCMSDGTIGDPGVNLVEGPGDARYNIAFESAPLPMVTYGYAGGNFGSVVKMPGGYVVGWASRGVSYPIDEASPDALYDFHEPAVAVLGPNRRLSAPPEWPFLTTSRPARDAVNVHAAPYGADKVLIVWETIDAPRFRPGMDPGEGFSTGSYGGTHFRFVDAAGKAVSDEEETSPSAIAPNGPDEIVQLSNGDLVWAYVPEPQRDFQATVSGTELPNLPIISQIHLVRLLYCTP